jgi:DNA polymerase III subunit delta'
MFFEKIPAKLAEKKYLIHLVNEGQVPHAQLFLAQEGTGALALAIAYASYLLCTDKKEQDSCGVCQTCIQAHKLIHPDLHFAFPVVKKDGLKREDTTSNSFMTDFRTLFLSNPFMSEQDWIDVIGGATKPNINVKECHEIASKLSLQAFGTGPKIMIIWLPEYLGKEGNRLLKLIEEPTDNTHIFLVSENQSLILPTILSRCQLVKLTAYHDNEIVAYLQSLGQTKEVEQVARISNGNINKALKIVSGNDINYSEMLINWMRVAYKSDAVELSDTVQQLSNLELDQQIAFIEYGLYFFREHLYFLATNLPPRLNNKEITVSEKMKPLVTIHKISHVSQILENIIFGLSRNANDKVLFMANTLQLGDILKNNMNNSMNTINFAHY